MVAPRTYGSPMNGKSEMAKTKRRKALIMRSLLIPIMLSATMCYSGLREKRECDRILVGLVAFGKLGEEAIKNNPDFSESEKAERLENFRNLQPILLGSYIDCLKNVPDNPNNPLEYL